MIRIKSVLVFLVVVVGLAISGYWLNTGGWLQMPRLFDVPAVLGGEERAEMSRGAAPGESREGRPMQNEAGSFPDSDGGARSHGHESNALNWDMLPDVLANLWIIALIVAVVTYSTMALAAISRLIERRPIPSQA